MAAVNKTPIQHFRSRTTTTGPARFTAAPAVAGSAGDLTLAFPTASLQGANVLGWAIDSISTKIASNTVVLLVTINGSNSVLTLSQALTGSVLVTDQIQFQQVREGELFINTADNRLAVGGYPQVSGGGNADVINVLDLIPSIKGQAGKAMRVSDDGLFITWGNVTAAGGQVTNVWAGQGINPITLTQQQPSGILTNPTTTYAQTQLTPTVTAVRNNLDGTYVVTVNAFSQISVGDVLSDSQADLNAQIQARVTLVNAALNQFTCVSSLGATASPWTQNAPTVVGTIWRSGLSSSGIQNSGFVTTDPTVLPYMQARNRSTAYAAFNNTTLDTGITSASRDPSTNLPSPFPANTKANIVDLAQGGFGIALANRRDINNASAPQQTTDTTTSTTRKDFSNWTANNFTAYNDQTTFFYRNSTQTGSWYNWVGTNRKVLVSDGVDSQWQPMPQSIQNFFLRAKSNPTDITNKGIFAGTGAWLRFATNSPIDTDTGSATTDRLSIRPDNQDNIIDLIQTAPMPVTSGGTGYDLRDAANTYWDGSKLKTNIAWSMPMYGQAADGVMPLVNPPYTYTVANTDPTSTYSYMLAFKGVQRVPVWTNSLQGIQLQGAALPAFGTPIVNNNAPLRFEGLGRFGVITGVNTYSAYVADGIIQAPTQVINQDLRLKGSSSASDSRLILDTVTTPTQVGRGLNNIRIDSGVANVNGAAGIASSLNQIAEDYVALALANNTLITDYTNSTVILCSTQPASGGQIQVQLAHSGPAINTWLNGQRGFSGVVFFTTAVNANISKQSIVITTSGGLGAPVVLRPLAGAVLGQFIAISWWSNGSTCIITVAAGD